jgi:hypothetical protein
MNECIRVGHNNRKALEASETKHTAQHTTGGYTTHHLKHTWPLRPLYINNLSIETEESSFLVQLF